MFESLLNLNNLTFFPPSDDKLEDLKAQKRKIVSDSFIIIQVAYILDFVFIFDL